MEQIPSFLGGHKSPAVAAGGGVDRIDLDTPPLPEEQDSQSYEYTDPKGNTFILDSLGQKTWSEKATFEGQYHRPGFTKRDAPIAAVFDLGEPEQLKDFNKLISKLDPLNPSIELISEDRQFYNGRFIVYISYSKVWYLLPTKK